MNYNDVTYQLDAAGTETVSLPANDLTPLFVIADIDGRRHVLTVAKVVCDTDEDMNLRVSLVCERAA